MTTTHPTPLDVRPRPTVTSSDLSRVLASGAVAGPVLFTLAWLVLGFVSPGYTVAGTHIAPYSLVSQPISGLGMDDTAPYMNTAFVLSGLLLLAGVIGVFGSTAGTGRPAARWVSAALLALSPIGLVVVGLFDLNSPLPHFTGAALIYLLPIISFPLAGRYLRRIPHWRRFGTGLLIAGALTLALTVIFSLTFNEDTTAAGQGIAGLTQRILFTEVLAWFAAMGWWALRRVTGRREG